MSQNPQSGNSFVIVATMTLAIGTVAVVFTANLILRKMGKPPVVATPARIDMKHVEQGSFVIKDVILRNEGDATLTLDKVDTSCGCTTASTMPTTILPHDSAHLQIQYNSDNRVGDFKQYVWVNFLGYKGKPVIIPVSGDIVRQYELSPLSTDLGSLHIGETRKGKVIITSVGEKNPNFVVMQSPPNVVANISSQSNVREELTFSLKADKTVGTHNESITLSNADDKGMMLPVKLNYKIVGIYQLSLTTINLGVVALNSQRETSVEITGDHADKIKISVFPDGCIAKITPKSNHQCVLKIEPQLKGGAKGTIDTLIALSTGNETQPEIRIPIYGTISKKPLAFPLPSLK